MIADNDTDDGTIDNSNNDDNDEHQLDFVVFLVCHAGWWTKPGVIADMWHLQLFFHFQDDVEEGDHDGAYGMK